jgi:phosphoribosylcarboxyaminoimidazole (NCAIR) mutase
MLVSDAGAGLAAFETGPVAAAGTCPVIVPAPGSLRVCGEISSARAFATEPGIALAAPGVGGFADAGAAALEADAFESDVLDAGVFDADVLDADAFDAAACSPRRYQQWRLEGCSMR